MSCIVSPSSLIWVLSSNGNTVADAVVAGHAPDGSQFHIARGKIENELAVGALHIGLKRVYIPFHGKAHSPEYYEVLTNPGHAPLRWIPTNGDQIPTGAVEGGGTSCGELIYVGRKRAGVAITPGKVFPRHNVIFVCEGVKEVAHGSFETLAVQRVKPQASEELKTEQRADEDNHSARYKKICMQQSDTNRFPFKS